MVTKNYREYRFGATGEHIIALQEALIAAGYSLPRYGADGQLGAETMTAVQQMEQDHAFTESLSWVIDATTLAFVLDNECVPEPGPTPPAPNPNIPQGKGMFQRVWKHMGQTPEVAAQNCVANGITWVAIQRLWQYPTPSDDNWYNGNGYNGHSRAQWMSALVDAGVQPWIWGWPVPGRENDFVSAMIETAEQWGAVGIIVDAESPWYQNGNKSVEATRLMEGLMASGLPIGFTSYGAPWNFSGMPWTEFSSADFGVPQIYDSSNNQADEYPTRSVDTWKELGFKHVVPASAAYNKTETQMVDLLARTPTPDGAIMWWDWYNANQVSYRWPVIRDYTIPSE